MLGTQGSTADLAGLALPRPQAAAGLVTVPAGPTLENQSWTKGPPPKTLVSESLLK